MLTIATRGQIFLVAGSTDMRKAFNTLAAVVRNELHRDPLSGDFCSVLQPKEGSRQGPGLRARRVLGLRQALESGTFAWPEVATPELELSVEELTLLLSGIDLKGAVPRRWYCAAQ